MKQTVLASIAFVLLLFASDAFGKCTKDTECKGERICHNGKCMFESQVRKQLDLPKKPGKQATTEQQNTFKKNVKVPLEDANIKNDEQIGKVPDLDEFDFSPTGMSVTDESLETLVFHGAKLDKRDNSMASRLGKRGFTIEDFIGAYKSYRHLQKSYPALVHFGRSVVETIAVGRKIGLDEDDLYNFIWYRHRGRRSMTKAYNQYVIGGRGFKIAGWTLSSIGAAFLVVGGAVYGASVGEGYKPMMVAGQVMMPVGAGLFATGIPFLVIGYIRTSEWYPEGALDKGTVESIIRKREAKMYRFMNKKLELASKRDFRVGISLIRYRF